VANVVSFGLVCLIIMRWLRTSESREDEVGMLSDDEIATGSEAPFTATVVVPFVFDRCT
jgi:hypothetical protein